MLYGRQLGTHIATLDGPTGQIKVSDPAVGDPGPGAHIAYSHHAPDLGGADSYTGHTVQ